MKLETKTKPLLFILALGFILRMLLVQTGTLELDVNTFIAWSYRLHDVSFSQFYEAWSDYLPGYLYVLWFIRLLAEHVSIMEVVLYKVPAILADLLTGWLIFKIVASYYSRKAGYIAASLYVFNPAVWFNSTLWGQVDSFTALLALAAVFFASRRPYLSAIILASGTAVKLQVAFAALVILFVMWRDRWALKKIGLYILLSGIVFALLFVPFTDRLNIFSFMYERIATTMGQYNYTSINAFSIWGYNGFWQIDEGGFPSSTLIGYSVIIIITILSALALKKEEVGEYHLAAIIFTTSFIFMTRMHERHLLFILAPILIIAFSSKLMIVPYVGFSLTYVANLKYSFVWITEEFRNIYSPTQLKLMVILNLVFLLLILWPPLISKVLRLPKWLFANATSKPKLQ